MFRSDIAQEETAHHVNLSDIASGSNPTEDLASNEEFVLTEDMLATWSTVPASFGWDDWSAFACDVNTEIHSRS